MKSIYFFIALRRLFYRLRHRSLAGEQMFIQQLRAVVTEQLPEPTSRYQAFRWWLVGYRRGLAVSVIGLMVVYGGISAFGYPPVMKFIPGLGNPVLASAIDGTLTAADPYQFRYQRIRFERNILPKYQEEAQQSFTQTIEIWQAGANLRRDTITTGSEAGLVFDFDSAVERPGRQVSCQLNLDPVTQQLQAPDTGLCLDLPASAEGKMQEQELQFITDQSPRYTLELVDHDKNNWTVAWTTPEPVSGQADLLYSTGAIVSIGDWRTTEQLDDVGNPVPPDQLFDCSDQAFLNCPAGDGYHHQLSLFTKHDTVVFLQLQTQTGVSDIYHLDLRDGKLRVATSGELVLARQAALDRWNHQLTHEDKIDQWYQLRFDNALAIHDQLYRLGRPRDRDTTVRDGHTIETSTYRLPSVWKLQVISQEFIAKPARTITFVVDVDADQLLEYTITDRDGQVLERAVIEEQTLLTESSDQFFRLDAWQQGIAKQLTTHTDWNYLLHYLPSLFTNDVIRRPEEL